MKFLKLFNTNIDYKAYRDGDGYILWAMQNVGADKPSDYGLYFQWGDTQGYTKDQVGNGEGQKQFAQNWSDYKWRLSGDSYSNVAFTKYTTQGATLELEDDAAHVHMGGDWHIPTPTQIQELLDNTTTARITSDGISGMTFTSKKYTSKSIFIPTPGYATNSYISYYGNYGYVMSSMLNINNLYPNNVNNVPCLCIYKNTFTSGINIDSVPRSNGFSICTAFFCFIGNCVAFPIKQKALRVDRIAEQDSIYNFQPATCSRPRMKRR